MKRRRQAHLLKETEFCDSCAQVCTSACRSAAIRDNAGTTALSWSSPIR